MTTASLPRSAIEADHKLEKTASSASEELARHRWHWTLDETNTKRVPIKEYARAVGRGPLTIRAHAKGYALWVGGSGTRPLNEELERARMSSEKEAATEAVANARGTSFGTTRKHRESEVRRVRDMARERAEKHGTRVEDEAEKVADWIVKSEKADKANQEAKAQRHGLRFIAVEGHLIKAMKALTDALNESHHVSWGDEERELLQDTIERVKSLLGLIDMSLVGAADVDWDAELARISEAGAA